MTDLLKDRLREALNVRGTSNKLSQEEEEELFKKEYLEMKGGGSPAAASYKVIPQFYKPLPRDDEVLQQKLREEARAQFLQRRSKLLLDNAELKVVLNDVLMKYFAEIIRPAAGAVGGAGQPHQRAAPGPGQPGQQRARADDGLGPVLRGAQPRHRQVQGPLQVPGVRQAAAGGPPGPHQHHGALQLHHEEGGCVLTLNIMQYLYDDYDRCGSTRPE